MKTGYAHFLNHEFAMQPTQTYANSSCMKSQPIKVKGNLCYRQTRLKNHSPIIKRVLCYGM